MVSEAVYVLCAITSVACGLLLLRGYRGSRHRLLFWSALCFAVLGLNNTVMVFDFLVLPSTDLTFLRHLTAHVALWVLLFGLVWTSRSEP